MKHTDIEMLIVQAARLIKDNEVVFAGVGLPIISVAVAKKFYYPNITIICESGIVDTIPTQQAMSIADPSLVKNCLGLFTVNEVFTYFLQGDRIDVGILGGAQVDRFGNLNSTVIGQYSNPKLRMPGSGGACDIASNATETIILMPQSKRRFVDRVDFVTSPGHIQEPGVRKHIRGKGPRFVVSNFGVYEFGHTDKEMRLVAKYKDITLSMVKENIGWDIKHSDELTELPPPSVEELTFIRKLDPNGIFLGKSVN